MDQTFIDYCYEVFSTQFEEHVNNPSKFIHELLKNNNKSRINEEVDTSFLNSIDQTEIKSKSLKSEGTLVLILTNHGDEHKSITSLNVFIFIFNYYNVYYREDCQTLF